MEIEVNYTGVLLAAVSSMVVGAIWYAPSVFGNAWIKLAKVDPKKASASSSWLYVWTFLLSLITAYVLAYVTILSNDFFKNSFLQDALTTGFWLWLGLVAARIATHDMFEGRRKKLTLLTLSHELVTLLVMALVIGLFGISG